MLYYVRTGDIDTSTFANNPKQAAIQAIKYSEGVPGTCVVVSEKELVSEDVDSHVFFFTESIMKYTAPSFRVVY